MSTSQLTSAPAPDGEHRRLTRTDFVLAALLTAFTAGVYAPAIDYAFVNYDDNVVVYDNEHVLGGLTLENVEWAFTTFHFCYWHPITWLTLQFDTTVWNGKPMGYHFTNLLIHAASTGLAYLVLVRLTGAVGRSFAVAALFGLHPLRVESVAWISERKDVLYMFFGLLALGAYARYAARPTVGRMLLVFAMFALSLMSKPTLVTLPFVLLLLDAWPLGRLRKRDDLGDLVVEKLPLFGLTILFCGLTFVASTFGGAIRGVNEVTVLERIDRVSAGYVFYLEKTFLPMNMTVFYPPRMGHPLWEPIAACAVLVALTAIAILLRRWNPAVLMGWLWFLGCLVPASGLMQVGETVYGDRHSYWPHLGLFIALVWGAAGLANQFRVPVTARFAVLALILAASTFVTRQQLPYWRDGRALWEHAIVVSPQAPYPRVNAGRAAYKAKDVEAAIRHTDAALKLDPQFMDALTFRMRLHRDLGR